MNIAEFRERRGQVQVIDVRHPHEWAAGRIDGSIHVPLAELADRLGQLDHGRLVVTVCRAGPRSAQAAEILRAHGLRADNLQGGILAWAEAGLPVMTPDGQAGSIAMATSETTGRGPADGQSGGGLALATSSMRDLDLAATVAATAEELGYATIWVADEPTGNGLAVAAAMQRATTTIRVGIGPLPCDLSRVDALVAQLAAHEFAPSRTAIALECRESPPWTDASLQRAFSDLREVLGAAAALGLTALGENDCRLAGEVADLVLLDWMSPDRIAWARRCIEQGSERRAAGIGALPQVVGCVRVAFGPGAGLRLGAQAAPYRAKPHYAQSFEAMGSEVAGIAAVDPSQAHVLAEPFRVVLDETAIRPVATLPTGESPALGELFEALSIILEVGHAFAPAPPLPG